METDQAIRAGVERLASNAFGRPLRIAGWQRLNSQTRVAVARVTLTDGAGRCTSVVAKHRTGNGPPNPDFAEELVNYRYLMGLRDRFDRFPRLLGAAPDLFVLEDLGPDRHVFPDVDAVVAAIAQTFAELHAATAGGEAGHEAVRAAAGLHDPDPRPRSAARTLEAFRAGCAILADHASILLGAPADTVTGMAEAALEDLGDPGPFRAFAHDDMADRRQCVVVAGRVLLVDFEAAKHTHALIDLAKPLIGKAERDTAAGVFTHNHPHLPASLAPAYRRAREAADGLRVSDAVWERQLGSALIAQTFLTVQRFHELSGQRFSASLAASLKSVLTQLSRHRPDSPAHRDLLALLDRLRERIAV